MVKYSDTESILIPKDFILNDADVDFNHSISYTKYAHIEIYRKTNNTIIYDITDLEAYVRKIKIENILKI